MNDRRALHGAAPASAAAVAAMRARDAADGRVRAAAKRAALALLCIALGGCIPIGFRASTQYVPTLDLAAARAVAAAPR